MGVVNVTPDSFSDGGRYHDPEAAIERALQMFAAGADLVDIGGESTRPGSASVSEAEELARVIPVIEGLANLGIEGISIDTTKSEVARIALDAGARIVNDISAMRFDFRMPKIVAGRAPVILMHTRGRPEVMQQGEIIYENGVVQSIRGALEAAAQAAQAAGVAAEDIVLDPGIGFGKTLADNLALIRGLPSLRSLGYPVLLGPSRKSFIGALTGKSPTERVFGTAAAVALAVAHGADLVRVHDVEAMVDVVKVADAVAREPAGAS